MASPTVHMICADSVAAKAWSINYEEAWGANYTVTVGWTDARRFSDSPYASNGSMNFTSKTRRLLST